MFDKMKHLMDMKKQADKIKGELDRVTVDVTEVQGIKIVMTGAQDFRSIEIDSNLLSPTNKNQLEKDLLKSVNAAIKKAQSAAAQRMAYMMPGF